MHFVDRQVPLRKADRNFITVNTSTDYAKLYAQTGQEGNCKMPRSVAVHIVESSRPKKQVSNHNIHPRSKSTKWDPEKENPRLGVLQVQNTKEIINARSSSHHPFATLVTEEAMKHE
jgi:hypothetical protein